MVTSPRAALHARGQDQPHVRTYTLLLSPITSPENFLLFFCNNHMTPSSQEQQGWHGKGVFVDITAHISHRVVLLDGVDVQALELDHRLHVALEGVELPQPRDLGAPLGLLRDLGQLAVAVLVVEQRAGGGLRRLEPVQRPLRGGPLRLPLLPPVVLLGGEGGLHTHVEEGS
uniref:Uncharacterized protein n=1 Tax=Zea mays TaxID=4577 RepID=A0A804RJF2_MAIZE